MATNSPQDDWHKTGLRLPKELHQQLHEAAAASGRSYNAEIVARLQESFTRTRRSQVMYADDGSVRAFAAHEPEPSLVSIRDLVEAQAHQLQLLANLIDSTPTLGEALAHEIDPEKNSALAKELKALRPPSDLNLGLGPPGRLEVDPRFVEAEERRAARRKK